MPEAILLKDVESVGERGDVVDVSKGYLRNFLIPRKLAQPATKGAHRGRPAQGRGRGARRASRPSSAPRSTPTCSTDGPHDRASRPARTAACSARSRPRTSPTRSRRRAASTSTAARSTSRSRSATSAPTWSSSRSPTASPRRSRRSSPSASRRTRRRPLAPGDRASRCRRRFGTPGHRLRAANSAQRCNETRAIRGSGAASEPCAAVYRSADEHRAPIPDTTRRPRPGARPAALDRGRAVGPRRDPAVRAHALRVRHRGGPAAPRTSTASATARSTSRCSRSTRPASRSTSSRVTEHLRSRGKLEEAGGQAEIDALTAAVPARRQRCATTARIVREHALLRRLLDGDLRDPGRRRTATTAQPRDLVERAERAMLEVAHDDRQKDFRKVGDVLHVEIDKWQKLSAEGQLAHRHAVRASPTSTRSPAASSPAT